MSYLYAAKNLVVKLFSKRPIVKNVQIVQLQTSHILEGRTALITGGTSGIGFAIAQAMLSAGAEVVITGRHEERLKEALSRLHQMFPHTAHLVHFIVMDNLETNLFAEKFEEAVSLTSNMKIDILVNNAGVQSGVFGTTTEAQYDLVLDTNLKGVYFLSQLFAQYMRNNQIHGNILNIASSSSLRPANSPYIISKWGIKGLTLGLAKMLIPYNIVVNGIAPGPTATPMLHRDEMQGIENDRNPMKRLVSPIEIANMAVVLTSGLGRAVVGDIVYMTGGAGVITMDDVECNLK